MLSTIGEAPASLVEMLRPGFAADVAARAVRLERNRRIRRKRRRKVEAAIAAAAEALSLAELEEAKVEAWARVGERMRLRAQEEGDPIALKRYQRTKLEVLRERAAGRAA